MIDARYAIDSQEQGYFRFDAIANKGRLVSLVEIPAFTARISIDLIVGHVMAVAAIALLVVMIPLHYIAAMASFLALLPGKNSKIAAVFVTLHVASSILLHRILKCIYLHFRNILHTPPYIASAVAGNVLGIIMPEIGRTTRLQYCGQGFYFSENYIGMIQSKWNLDKALATVLQQLGISRKIS